MRFSVDSQPRSSARWLAGDSWNWLQREAFSVIDRVGVVSWWPFAVRIVLTIDAVGSCSPMSIAHESPGVVPMA